MTAQNIKANLFNYFFLESTCEQQRVLGFRPLSFSFYNNPGKFAKPKNMNLQACGQNLIEVEIGGRRVGRLFIYRLN
jgi:hypothetical protein